jgi:hypothetical protein
VSQPVTLLVTQGSPNAAGALSYAQLQVTVNELQESQDEGKAAFDAFRTQTSQLVLRQASFMVLNKLARLHLKPTDDKPPLSPWLASRYNLNNLRHSRMADKPKLEHYLASKPDLENGLSLLANTFTEAAHPTATSALLSGTGDAVITLEYLKQCLEEECPAGIFPDREAVDAVLEALVELSDTLGESLFVPTSKPS